MADPMSDDFFKAGAGPDTAMARFYVAPVQDASASDLQGHPIYEDREFVEIRHPGDRSYSFVSQVTDEHRARWPMIYAAFKNGLAVPEEGTPIEQWPPITPSQALNFKFQNIRTVEDLATVPDAGLQNLGLGARDLRAKALAWLANARDNASAMKAAADLEREREKSARLEAQLAELATRIEAVEAAPKRRGKQDVEAA